MEDSRGRVFVVLPAAGTGERFGSEKQFRKILGRPILSYTIETFSRMSDIEQILVLVQEDRIEETKSMIREFSRETSGRMRVAAGKWTRHRTIKESLRIIEELQLNRSDIVVVHDAVRIFCTEELLKNVVKMASFHGAAGVTRPLVSTVLRPIRSPSSGDAKLSFLEDSLDRCTYVASEMPQAFTAEVFQKMYSQLSDCELDCGTECLQLAKKYGGVVPVLLPGPEYLWKITHPKDFDSLSAALKSRNLEEAFLIVTKEIQILELLKSSTSQVFQNVTVTENIQNLSQQNLEYKTVILNASAEDSSLDCSAEEILHVFRMQRKLWLGAVVIIVTQKKTTTSDHFEKVNFELRNMGTCILLIHSLSTNTPQRQLAEVVAAAITTRSLILSGMTITLFSKK